MKKDEQLPEFVVTVPPSLLPIIPAEAGARITLGVLVQLIVGSKKEIIIAAPFIQDLDDIDENFKRALKTALDNKVNVIIVSTEKSINLSNFCSIFKGYDNIQFYQPQANVDNRKKLGSHAKFFISDGQHAYIGSANITDNALSENLEMGLLVHGDLARQITNFWDTLVRNGFFVPAK